MALTIRAKKNNLGTSESPYYALASWSRVVECEDYLERMAKGRTTLSKTDIIAVLQLAGEELVRLLAEGCYVKTPLGAAIPIATGRFRSRDESFFPKKPASGHSLRIDFRLDPKLEAEALASIECIRDRKEDPPAPFLKLALSQQSGKRGEVESGGLLRVEGSHLKFDPADSAQGLFFREEGTVETRAAVYAYVRPSSVAALVPSALREGSYELLLRSGSKDGQVFEGRLDEMVRVIGAS